MAGPIATCSVDDGVTPRRVDRVTRWDRTMFRLTMLLAVAPIIASAIQNGISGWYPTRDAAYTTVWIRDVFSAHTPLHGQPMRFPGGAADVPYYLGVVHHCFLAVPVELFGVSWGLLIGMALLNTGWVLLALWLLRRRVGYRAGLIGCVTVTMLIWSLGSQLLIDPTPVQAGPLAFCAFCVAAWSVADADHRALVPLAVTSSYLFLLHPQYVLVVPVPAAIALVAGLARLRRMRADTPDRWLQTRRAFVRGTVGAFAATVVLWLPAIIDQVFRPGGNIRVWFTSMLNQSGSSEKTILDTIRVVSSPLTVPPFWFRDSISAPAYAVGGPIGNETTQLIALIVVGAVVLATLIAARRRADETIVTGIVIGVAAWITWIVTIYRQPGNLYIPAYLVTSWPLAAFVTTVVLLGTARCTRVRSLLTMPAVERRAGDLAVGMAGVFVLLALPTVDFGASTTREDVAAANHIRREIRAHVGPGSPVLVVSNHYPTRAYLPVAILELEDMGIPVRVRPGRDTMLYRSFRGLERHRSDAGRRLVLTPAPLQPSPGSELIATGGKPLHESLETHIDRTHALEEWAESTDEIRAAPTARLEPDERRPVDEFLSRLQAGAEAKHQSIFGSRDLAHRLVFADTVLRDEGTNLAEILAIPGITATQLQIWLDDQMTILDGGRYFVYLEPL